MFWLKNILHNIKLKRIDADNGNVIKNISFWSLAGKKLKCKPVHIYDGDTIHVIIILNNKPCKWKVRMLGYDSPEMKPLKSKENREDEIKRAKEARDALKSLIFNKVVEIEFGEFDKYGRPLGTICANKININEWMIKNNHGYPYNGGTKR
tara:strand:- start:2938 stop:3390 length:453 start_codon:yes stop_codon:yes gene_type:complete